ncbi:lysylphosphatidylglycerol synthase domain-containing protein [Paraburkholderia sp. B3]|uniref:lysylphosphatidylglycerol synthase domain-containing protein n=1 Tax=Paraburkholderia sp. B3 TaxID=3134791 RepID=UPI003981C6CF
MKHLGRIAALVGFSAAVWLVLRDHPATVWQLIRNGGSGLVLSACVHVLPMCANAWDWRTLIRPAERPSFAKLLKFVWLRESVNGLLPVARIGGEILSFRLLGRSGVRPASAIASLVVDVQLTLISQVVFALVACGYLLGHSTSGAAHLAGTLVWSIAGIVPILTLFALVQHARPFERMARTLNQVTSGKMLELVGKSARVDQSIKLVWRQTGNVARYLFVWQTVQCAGFALEIWIALRVLGTDATFAQAFVIEALIQLVSSVAFLVPGSLGVQEGGFVLIGGVLGFDAPTCLALAGARRIRDLLFYAPGLVAWQVTEYVLPQVGRHAIRPRCSLNVQAAIGSDGTARG